MDMRAWAKDGGRSSGSNKKALAILKIRIEKSKYLKEVKVLTKVHSYLSNPPDLQKNETFLSKATGKSVES